MHTHKIETVGVALMIVLVGVVVLGSGCASVTGPDDEFPRGQMDAADTFEAASQWLPADSLVVAAAAGDPDLDQWRRDLLPVASPDIEPGETGSIEALEEEFRAEYVEMIGFDPIDSHAIALAAVEDGVIGVLFGSYDEPTGLDTTEVEGQKVYSLSVDQLFTESALGLDTSLYLWPTDDPAGAMVVATDRDLLPVGETTALADEGDDGKFQPLFEQTEGATIAAVTPLAEAFERLGEGDERLPDSVLMRYDDRSVALAARGNEEGLEMLDEYLMQQLGEWSDPVEQMAQWDDNHVLMELLNTYTRHGLASVSEQLSGGVEDGSLRYQVNRAGASDIALAASLVLIATGTGYASIAVGFEQWEREMEEELQREQTDELIELQEDDPAQEHHQVDSSQTDADGEHGEYTCPMHPEVRKEDAGQCPTCKMDLVKTDKTESSP